MKKTRLNSIIKYAYENVPYFNNIINKNEIDIKKILIIENLKYLPIFSKETIKEIGWVNFVSQEYLDDNYNLLKDHDIRIEETSGTTMEPMEIPWINDYYYSSIMNHWRNRQIHFGILSSDKVCTNFRNKKSSKSFSIYKNFREMRINTCFLTYENIIRIIDYLQEFEPEWLYIQPSVLFIFVK
ncbi:MAG: hypothetical protein ACYCYI_09380, partial [Saccharofermentanales bacterium]